MWRSGEVVMNRPFANTTTAVDFVFWLIAGISVLLLLLVTGLMIYFAIRYSRKRNPKASEVKEHPMLEIAWTAIPTLIVLVMFWYGYRAFLMMRAVPSDALVIKATGKMWEWSFEYPNGKTTTEVLYVPSGKAIKVELRSTDVVHGFYVPAFRVKEDAVPGKKNYLWFKPQGFGPADIFCSQYCGLKHAYMIGHVEVMEPALFEAWYTGTEAAPQSGLDVNAVGYALLVKYGCVSCHRLDESRLVGPGLRGLYGRNVTVIEDGAEKVVTSDDAYLREKILKPGKHVVKGYPGIMPRLASMTEADAQAIAEYLKTLK
jgi:cytochrome c oxidase subunit 2